MRKKIQSLKFFPHSSSPDHGLGVLSGVGVLCGEGVGEAAGVGMGDAATLLISSLY